MKLLGIILIVIGLIGFVFQGITYTTTEEVLDIGPVEVQSENQERIPITPVASGIAVVAGIALVVVGSRKT